MEKKDLDFIKDCVNRGENASDGYFEYAHIVAINIPRDVHGTLNQLVHGPTSDGDIISKSMRGFLFEIGLAVRVCHKGEQGFTGATYFAYSVNEIINKIKSGKNSA